MSVVVRYYEKQDAEAWDSLVAESWNGTFLHTRRFLAYHGERFKDLSLVMEDNQGRITGIFPAALDPAEADTVVSHPGLTFGGIVHGGSLRGPAMIEALQAVAETYRSVGLRSLRYKVVPYIYRKVPSADDLYALFRLGAVRYRCDLSATVDLTLPQMMNKLRRRDLRKARQAGVQIASGPRWLEPYWKVLEDTLSTKYGVRPVHTLEEIAYLQAVFPEQIECVVATVEDQVAAGVVLFHTPGVAHVQYSSTSALGDRVSAQTAVVEYVIAKSRDAGIRYFDLGISNEREGRLLNEGLYRFKTSFGAGGIVHEFYGLELSHGHDQAS